MLPSPDGEALRLRFDEKKSYPVIAATVDVSVDAAQRMVAKAGRSCAVCSANGERAEHVQHVP